MSRALPGVHLCKAHQGNHSHYAEENCLVCRMSVVIDELLERDGAEGFEAALKTKALALLAEARDPGHANRT